MFSLTLYLIKFSWMFQYLLWVGTPYKNHDYHSKADHYAIRSVTLLGASVLTPCLIALIIVTKGILLAILLGGVFSVDIGMLLTRMYYVHTKIKESKGSNLPVPADIWKDD